MYITKHTGKTDETCTMAWSCMFKVWVPEYVYVALLILHNTETQFSLSLEKHGESVMVQLVIIIYYSTS